ncbi:MAG: HAD-IA family hydrolase [Anaerolineae bacterium]|nr:HAD-IA family hydrolase [Anaerolineae bacterium]
MEVDRPEWRYDTVVFDVGGTLLGFHDCAPFREFLQEAGLPALDEDARAFHRRLIGIIVAERDEAEGLGAENDELYQWWRGVFRKAWAERPALGDEMVEWLFAGRFDRLYDDVVPALEALRRLNLGMGVLSNFGTHLRTVLARFGLTSYFDFVVVSAEEGMAKPDARIFERVVAEAGRPVERILYVGDHVGDDVEGARGAGMDAVLIDRGDHQPHAPAARIDTLLDLVAYVRAPTVPARAIVLDMDGVVLDSMPDHLVTWQETLAPLGIDLTAEHLYPLEGVPTEPTARRLTEQFLGYAVPDQEARRLAGEKRERFRARFKPRLVEGMASLLHDLGGRGYRLALVTGSARSVVEESLVPTGVADLFEVIVTGDEVERGKPDPEPYGIAARRLGVDPERCLAVENAPLGIESARAAGMMCVALETTLPAERLAKAGAARVFADVWELRRWAIEGWKRAVTVGAATGKGL